MIREQQPIVSLDVRMISFIRDIANRCHDCLHKSESNCRECESRVAKLLVVEWDATRQVPKNPTEFWLPKQREKYILKILRASDRPLKAIEIDLSNYCSRANKQQSIYKLLSAKVISRRKNGKNYEYFLNKNKDEKNNANK